MTQSVYSLSISARAILNLHSLNNEGGEGNQIQTRMVDIVTYDSNKQPRLANVNAISGDMFKHIQAEHLHRIAVEKGLPLCQACQRFDANRMSSDSEFRNWIKADSPTSVQILDRLISCTIDNLEGNLVTEGKNPGARKSVVEFGWVVCLPDEGAGASDEYFHVKYVPDRREKPTDKDEREGNLGQAIFHRPTNSGVYAIVTNLELSRIGYNDISHTYVAEADRQAQYAALLESMLYTFVEMNGAMRNTQMPHLVALDGVVAVSYGIAPAPTVSPLNKDFKQEIEGTRDAINRLHKQEVIQVLPFDNLTQFADILSNLILETEPYTMQSAGAV